MASPQNPAPAPVPPAPDLPETAPFVLTLPDDAASGRDWYLWAGVLALLVMVAYFPAAWGKFIWDDDHHATAPVMSRPDGLEQIWTVKGATRQWYPLTFSSFWIDNRLWHDPFGFHLENMLIQAGAALLLWRLLRRLGIALPWLIAAIWAIHPLQVESVSWISERKNLLSGVLFLGSLWFFVDYMDLADPKGPASVKLKDKPLAYGLSLVLFVLAMLAKTAVCALPVVALALLWWKRRDLKKVAVWLSLAPFFVVALGMSAVTVYFESAPGGTEQASGPDYALSAVDRLMIAGRGVWFYVAKLIWPVNLSFSYPQVNPGWLGWFFILAAVAVLAAFWHWRDRIGRGPFAALVCYGALLFPSLGFFNIYPMRYTYVADHYQYLAGIPLIILAVEAARWLREWAQPPQAGAAASPWAAGVAAFVLLLLMVPAWLRANVFHDSLALWTDTYAKNKSSWMARDNLAIEYLNQAGIAEARAAGEDADDTDAVNDDLGDAKQYYQNAEDLFHQALDLRHYDFVAYNGLGRLYVRTNRWKDAEAALILAVKNEPQSPAQREPAPYINYAIVLFHNHPDWDVSAWYEEALDLGDQPRVSPIEIGNGELEYGSYLFKRAEGEQNNPATEEDTLNAAANHLLKGIAAIPNQPTRYFVLSRVYRGLSELEQNKADEARSAGNPDLADKYQASARQYDGMELTALLQALKNVSPLGHYPEALADMGEWSMRQAAYCDSQTAGLAKLEDAVQSFNDANSLAPQMDLSSDREKALALLIAEGNKSLVHPSLWAPMKAKLDLMLAATGPTPSAQANLDDLAASAGPLLEQVLWPLLPQVHPLRDPLGAVRYAVQQYMQEAATSKRAEAVAALHDAVKTALGHWGELNSVFDQRSDAFAATRAFDLALKADRGSAVAYNGLVVALKELKASTAGQPENAELAQTIADAEYQLKVHLATTRAATRAATNPTTSP